MTRHGLTLIELMLAVALGAVVALAGVSVLGMMNRAERLLDARARHTGELATLRGQLQKAMGSLVMSDAPRPTQRDLVSAGQDATLTIGGVLDASGNLLRPRLALGADESAALQSQSLRADLWSGRGGGRILRPQRLEVTVSVPPAGFRAAEGFAGSPRSSSRVVRGVFELRPDEDSWSMWWRPVQPDGSPQIPGFETRRELSAVRLASGIVWCQWQAFRDRERVGELDATWSNELPAYMELEVETVSGLYANWLFEMGWSVGPETIEAPDADDDEDGGAESGIDAAGPGGADEGGATGGAGGTSRQVPGGPNR
ncbi:MAG: prepilin-type N-terminal cleavage/methylation domain-containing protein [Phycisphaeraceae bacterium]|nr:prepilin-type N-terminal cleavage/methylation domain-containing protein [Phycisphaeraceae bacterium]